MSTRPGSTGPGSTGPVVAVGPPRSALRIGVVGTGYLGATHAAAMAELGFDVVGVDRDSVLIEALESGRAPFFEPGIDDLLTRYTRSGRLRFSTRLEDVADSDVVFVCVGTPQVSGGEAADLGALHAVVGALAPLLRPDALIVGKSTVPVGTARRLRTLAAERAGRPVELVWNPEFLREGHGVQDSLRPDRLVIGCDSPAAERRLREVYAGPLAAGVPLVVTDLETSELVKTAANAFLATKVSFANLMADLCDRSGGDVLDLTRALGLDERIGPRFLGAGVGFGGGCLPKDLRALAVRGEQLGADMGLLREVDGINDRARDRIVRLVERHLEPAPRGMQGARVAVLGAAFKAGSDDVRDSPALAVAGRLEADGARVSVYDPQANIRARAAAPRLRYCANPAAACRGADVVVVLTEWAEFAELDPAELLPVVRSARVVDARHVLDADRWAQAGWEVLLPGRPARGPAARDTVSVLAPVG